MYFVEAMLSLVAVFYLSRTREYSVGVKELSKRYDIFWFLAVGGGAILGAIFVTVFIFGSLKTILDSFGVEASGEWLKTPGVLAAIASLGFLPYLASRAESKKLDG